MVVSHGQSINMESAEMFTRRMMEIPLADKRRNEDGLTETNSQRELLASFRRRQYSMLRMSREDEHFNKSQQREGCAGGETVKYQERQ